MKIGKQCSEEALKIGKGKLLAYSETFDFLVCEMSDPVAVGPSMPIRI